jgi:hypothetical protein
MNKSAIVYLILRQFERAVCPDHLLAHGSAGVPANKRDAKQSRRLYGTPDTHRSRAFSG